jgi:hypothetical protein
MNAEQWDGPIQDATRRHDEELGHLPKAPAVGSHSIGFFQPPTRPTGGTAYVSWFRRAPTGGGTVFQRPDFGNPYARIDEDPSPPRPAVDVGLPPLPEETR